MLRKRQAKLQLIVDGIIAGSEVDTIYVNATPGSGKSMLPIIIGKLIKAGLADSLVWIVPRKPLQNQGEHNFLDPCFRDMLHHNMTIRSSTNDINPCRGLDGFITIYQAIISDDDQTVLSELRNKRYILILDEFHHIEDMGVWFKAINPLWELAAFKLLFTGTIERGNGSKIALDYVPETPSEIETSLRDQIESHVRQFSFVNRYNPKRLNTEIQRYFDKPRGVMTSNELEAVLAHVKRTYPLNGNGCPARGTILYDQIAKPRGGGIRVPTKARAWEEEGDSKCQAR